MECTLDGPGSETVRTRFAPSPTGYLHVGGARTALFNWLFARHCGGQFILRIEDTDVKRSTDESVNAILESMSWLGLDWDEGPGKGGPHGPYFQSERAELYRRHARDLIDSGHAYRCYCTPEEIETRRQERAREGLAPVYDRKCRRMTSAEARRAADSGRPWALRFAAPERGSTWVRDIVRGDVEFDHAVLDDFVIMKSDGMPTYNYAAVIDDHYMKITHVIRGEEHLSNTPKQILLYRALGLPLPRFAHIPMILGPDRAKLSKRHGATSVTQYRDAGYLPDALVNYLALLGWAYDAEQQVFSRDELVRYFTLEKVTRNPAVFDPDKLEWMNGVYLRKLSDAELARRVAPFLEGAADGYPPEFLERACATIRERIRTLAQAKDTMSYYFSDPQSYEDAGAARFLAGHDVAERLEALAARLGATDERAGADAAQPKPLRAAEAEEITRSVARDFGVAARELIHPARLALTGKTASPGLFEVMEVLGRSAVVRRLLAAARYARSGSERPRASDGPEKENPVN